MESKREEKMEGNRESWMGKNKIVMQTMGYHPNNSDFHIMDLENDTFEKIESVGVLWNHDIPDGLISVNSVIYAIGKWSADCRDYDTYAEEGIGHLDHPGTSFLDLSDPIPMWKGIDGMLISDRWLPGCAFLGGKIFVFGFGLSYSDPLHFGEFYDMKKKKKKNGWKAIPPPPGISVPDLHFTRPVICDPRHNRILVHFFRARSLYAYYPEDNHRWVCLGHPQKWGVSGRPASYPVDDVVYLIVSDNYTGANTHIDAYDICTKKHLEVSWTSCSPFGARELLTGRVKEIHYLGDNIMCLPVDCIVKDPHTGIYTSYYKFYRFQVSRVSMHQVFLIPRSTHLFEFQGTCKYLKNVVAI